MTGLVIMVIGPPLSGKSTFARRLARVLDAGYFSVRAHFEPLRQAARAQLPEVGTLLPDEVVLDAALPTLDAAKHGGRAVLDGVPTTEQQAQHLVAWLDANGVAALWVMMRVDRSEAVRRATARRVCVRCDGGVNEARRSGTGAACAACGGPLSQRPDDTPERFATRWSGYESRLRRIAAIAGDHAHAPIATLLHAAPAANDGAVA